MRVSMSDDKKTEDQPTFVIAAPQSMTEKVKSKLTKKHVVIAVVSLTTIALVVVCVLVAMHIYTGSNKDIVKFQMSMKDKGNNDVTQEVSKDANANVVQYHVVKDGMETWILQDFDKDIQVTKVVTDSSVGCYVNHLNRSATGDPNAIPNVAPKTNNNTDSRQVIYLVSKTAISDTSFLGARATTMCKNIPTYWMEPSCGDAASSTLPQHTNATAGDRQKRSTLCAYYYGYCGGVWGDWDCVCGCCGIVCGSFASYSYTYYYDYSTGYYVCSYYMNCVAYNAGTLYRGYPYYCWYNGNYIYYP